MSGSVSVARPAARSIAVELSQVHRRADAYPALERAQLRLAAGTVTALTGEPGSGVDTLLGLLSTRLAPTSGRVLIGGHDTVATTGAARAATGWVPATPIDWGRLRVQEALETMMRAHGLPRREARRRLAELLAAADLTYHAMVACADLPRRLTRRLTLACALAHSPRLVVLEAPFAHLPVDERAEVVRGLRSLAGRGATVVFGAAPDLDVDDVADRIVVLEGGRLAASHDLTGGPRPERWRIVSDDGHALRIGLTQLGIEHLDVAGPEAPPSPDGEVTPTDEPTPDGFDTDDDPNAPAVIEVTLAQGRDAADLLAALVRAGVPVRGFLPPAGAGGAGQPPLPGFADPGRPDNFEGAG